MALFEDEFPPNHALGSRMLSQGDSGTDVAVIQAVYDLMLRSMNPPEGPMGQPIKITGHFDAETVQAVKNIQSYFGLPVNGEVSASTYFVFGQGADSLAPYGGPDYGSRQLQQGDHGGDVTVLQNRLNGFRYASLIGHPANGVFDSGTALAVLAFKHDAVALGDTGFPDNAIAGLGFYDASWLYTLMGGRNLQSGRFGFDVIFLQVLLKQLGYYGGRVTGYYDPATLDAVRDFQRSQGIAGDGVVGPVTIYHLGRKNAVGAPHPLGVAWPLPQLGIPYRDCSLVLVPEVLAQDPFASPPGGSLWIRQFENGSLITLTSTWGLPDPSRFDPSYNAYVLTLPVYPYREMTPVYGVDGGVWVQARQQSYGSPLLPDAEATIRPGRDFEPLGPVVLKGVVESCG